MSLNDGYGDDDWEDDLLSEQRHQRDLWEQQMDEMMEEARQDSEREWAERFTEALDYLVGIGVLTEQDSERTITLSEMEAILEHIPNWKDNL